jgi:antitoxin component of MazEF toxin-antitoxin module
MKISVRVVKIGDSVGIIIPDELLDVLDVQIDETLFAAPTTYGVELTKADPDFMVQMTVAREVMARRVCALRELAK